MLELWDGARTSVKQLTQSNKPAQNQQASWLALGWNTFGARTSHERPWTHKTHHGSDLGETTTFPHIVYFAPLCGSGIQMVFLSWDSQMGVPKSPRPEVLQLYETLTSSVDLRLGRGLNQSCSPRRDFPTTCRTPLARKGIGSNPNFLWSKVNLPVWFPTFLLAITCVADVQMGHANPFWTSKLQ
jgi:hypothetical protein